MPKKEAARFFDRYKSLAPSTRHGALKELANNDEYADIRSPFFFGFYAFEDRFIRIPDFVRLHLDSLTPEQARLIGFVALVSAYSQQRMPMEILWRIAGNKDRRNWRLGDLLGEGSKRFIVGGSSVGIAHPKIAKELIKQYLQPANANSEMTWKAGLADFCCDFVGAIAKSVTEDSQIAEELVSQIFVDRSPAQGREGYAAQFSPIINELPSEQAGQRVLKALCENFEDNPHFWNHLGRFSNMKVKAPYQQSERCLLNALDKAGERGEEDGLHWHGLGMVYRFEIDARLVEARRNKMMPDAALNQIADLFESAEKCFHHARESNSTESHGYVTHIQMILKTIEHLLRLSGKNDYASFFQSPEKTPCWCRDRVSRAEQLLDRLRHNYAEASPSRYLIECESGMLNLYGNFDAMISSLSALLTRVDVKKAPVRRSISWAYLRNVGWDLEKLSGKNARRIATMALQNMSEDPASRQDVLLWLRAFRLLPEFTIAASD